MKNTDIDIRSSIADRAEKCMHSEFCGGCAADGACYEDQLAAKQQQVDELVALKRLHIDKNDKIQEAPEIFRYRNKMEYTFGDMEKGGPMTLGMHVKKKFMSVVTVDNCMLVHEDFNRILKAVLEWTIGKGYSAYHKKSHKGLMRHLVLRRGVATKEILVNIVTSGEDGFDEEGFVKLIRSLSLEHKIAGILRTINDGMADAVRCDELKVLYGVPYYMEEIMGLKFNVSAFSFFQTNVKAAERLYTEALGLIDDVSGKTVFDLFCGTGTITQAVAMKAKKAVGIEIVEEAVKAARENADINGISNCEFIAGDVFEVLDSYSQKPDVIIVDPPRAGISPKALDRILSYGVDQIVYISCNPRTMVENLYYLQYNGYHIRYLKPFDNFPNTKHIECICLLEKNI